MGPESSFGLVAPIVAAADLAPRTWLYPSVAAIAALTGWTLVRMAGAIADELAMRFFFKSGGELVEARREKAASDAALADERAQRLDEYKAYQQLVLVSWRLAMENRELRRSVSAAANTRLGLAEAGSPPGESDRKASSDQAVSSPH